MTHEPDVERIQREHELLQVYKAAKRLEELMEMAGLDPAPVRAIRKGLGDFTTAERVNGEAGR